MPVADELAERRRQLRRYKATGDCPLCGAEVDTPTTHERDSSNDQHTCVKCGWLCGEMELWNLPVV